MRSLLGEGIAMVTRPGWSNDALAPAATCLSGGAERLLKLTIGLAAEAAGQPWPTDLASLYGHRVEELRPDVEQHMKIRLANATHAPYIMSLIDDVSADLVLPKLLRALAAWAETPGRYREFMILDGTPVAEMSPVTEEWEAAERCTWVEIDTPRADPRFPGEVRHRLASSLLRWWFFHYRAWEHGIFGQQARQSAGYIDPRSYSRIEPLARTVLHGR